ncbi:unnamed protein product [Paramecium sonneborni]|uniref:RNA helicase n=1 Tax=Paramecium sonneborni TaxID=65129 RepID=A0A8S1LLW1_9CILI|nr:unnamed protein product [Paramecium sonneborni]
MDKYHLYNNVECNSNEEIIIYPTFESMQLKIELIKGIYAYGYTIPSVIQQKALVPIIQGRDVILQSLRSTGKTTVVALSILSIIDFSVNQTQVLILSKTRQKAEYTAKTLIALGNYLNIQNYILCFGVNSLSDNVNILQKEVQIVSSSLDQVFNLIQRKILNISHLKMIILNQVDEILIDYQTKPQVYDIYKFLEHKTQNILVTETQSQDILDFIEKFINKPLIIKGQRNELTLEGIKQFFIRIDKEEWKFETLYGIYDIITVTQSVIFCSTKQKCEWLANKLRDYNLSVALIDDNMSQQQRDRIMTDFRQGNQRVLIATDIQGISIDIQVISLIINYDFPKQKELYINRIGRKGKFGRKSVAINFLISEDLQILNEIEQYYWITIEEMPINFTDYL